MAVRGVRGATTVRANDAKAIFDATADVLASPNKGLPDGLKVDQKGNIFATAVNGVYVFAPDFTFVPRCL